jgi:CRISPR system Cascade subunit CasA
MGLLHNFLLGKTLLQTLWLNLFTRQQIERSHYFVNGLGTPPWEQMPEGEACPVAEQLKGSLMGRLVPLCRFCLLVEEGLHYSEGCMHLDYNSGMADPSVAIDSSAKKARALWTNPEKRPWRELTALIVFIFQQRTKGFECWQIQAGLDRACEAVESFALWSGGLRVSSNAGEQYTSGSDDFVESQIWLFSDMLGEIWFSQLQQEMAALDGIAKILYGCVIAYFKEQLVDSNALAAQATNLYWQLCERDFQDLVDNCHQDEINKIRRHKLRLRFADYVQQTYNRFCPNTTARQLDAWAKCRPNLIKYLKQEN